MTNLKPLMTACQNNDAEQVKFLLSQNVSIHVSHNYTQSSKKSIHFNKIKYKGPRGRKRF